MHAMDSETSAAEPIYPALPILLVNVQYSWAIKGHPVFGRDLPSILPRSCYIVLCQSRIVLCKKDPATSGKLSHSPDCP